MPTNPTLYTFRRCPYAMRARMALAYAGVMCNQIEVDLKHKPAEMLALSPKGTVPVLQLADGRVLEESLDIMRYALSVNDPDGWLLTGEGAEATDQLIARNDKDFKILLDKFKYHVRHKERSRAEHQARGEAVLAEWEALLFRHKFLLADRVTLADIALFPFVRQWHGSGEDTLAGFPRLAAWLAYHLDSPLFQAVMPAKAA